jgi:hypothetical protein
LQSTKDNRLQQELDHELGEYNSRQVIMGELPVNDLPEQTRIGIENKYQRQKQSNQSNQSNQSKKRENENKSIVSSYKRKKRQTARRSTGGAAPRGQLATKAARMSADGQSVPVRTGYLMSQALNARQLGCYFSLYYLFSV